ncbi:MAG TPA: hypothetical protein PLZ38_08590, partial [Spirochaetota bacterium]|nr:hypothetical protein [Spirochaetota bacterium]
SFNPFNSLTWAGPCTTSSILLSETIIPWVPYNTVAYSIQWDKVCLSPCAPFFIKLYTISSTSTAIFLVNYTLL